MLLIFIIVFLMIFAIEYYYRKTVLNIVCITYAPYVAIVFINNVFCSRLGYYTINDSVITYLLISMLLTMLGALLCNLFYVNRNHVFVFKSGNSNVHYEADIVEKNIRLIKLWICVCCFLRGLQILSTFSRYGMAMISANDFEEFGFSGLPSHLFLTVYPMAAILFYHGLKKKDKTAFVIYGISLLIATASFIKYHAIFFVMITYIYAVIKDRSMAKKLLVFIAGMIIILFVGNYVVSFVIRGFSDYTANSLMIKLWDYVGGSVINGNVCMELIGREVYSAGDFLKATFLPLFNTIFGRLLGIQFDLNTSVIGFRTLNVYHSTSNVHGMIFNPALTDSLPFYIFYCLLYGAIVNILVRKILYRNSDINLLFYTTAITTIIMTFFANYFGLSAIWELLLWSYCIPRLFTKKHIKFVFGMKRIN